MHHFFNARLGALLINVIEVFVVDIHAALFDRRRGHAGEMKANTRWIIRKSDHVHLVVRLNSRLEYDNVIKFRIRVYINPQNGSFNIPCILPLIGVIFDGSLVIFDGSLDKCSCHYIG
jgi:hypothetical protein